MARIKNDNLIFNVGQKLIFLDDDGTTAASAYWDGDALQVSGWPTASGLVGPEGPPGTGIPGNYIGDEDGNTRVTVDGYDHIVLKTAGHDRWKLDEYGHMTVNTGSTGDSVGLLNIEASGAEINALSLDKHGGGYGPAFLTFRRSRNNREIPQEVIQNDYLGGTMFYGHDGIDYVHTASMLVKTDGPVSEDQVPSKFEFWTAQTNSETGTLAFSIHSGGGVSLLNGSTVNNISSTVDVDGSTDLVTGQGIYGAIETLRIETNDKFATFSGIDLRMNRLFDPSVSGTEIKIEDDSIRIYNQELIVGQWDSAGMFSLDSNGAYVNTIYDGSLASEASHLAIPTAASVKAYVDAYGGSGSGFAGHRLVSESGVSSLSLGDTSWTGMIANRAILNIWEASRNPALYGAGVKTYHTYMGDMVGTSYNPTDFLQSNTYYGGLPTLLLHGRSGSVLYLYNSLNYGDDTLRFYREPGIVMDRRGIPDKGIAGSIKFVCGSTDSLIEITAVKGNTETWPSIPGNELYINAGIVKMTKLRLMEDHGNYNNCWVDKIVGCHPTRTHEELGSVFYKYQDAEYVVNQRMGDNDYCLVTGKYVHTLFNSLQDAVQRSSSVLTGGGLGFNAISNKVEVSGKGVKMTYGLNHSDEFVLDLFSGGLAENNNYGQILKSGARFQQLRSSLEPTGNRIFLECAWGLSPPDVFDVIQNHHASTGKFIFFKSRGAYYGQTNIPGNGATGVGDCLGSLSWQGQGTNTGWWKNACEFHFDYNDAAAIRAYATNVVDAGVIARLCLYSTQNFDGGGDMAAATTTHPSLVIDAGRIYFGSNSYHGDPWGGSGNSQAQRYATFGRLHTRAMNYPKNQLTGDFTFSACGRGKGGSLMFGGRVLTSDMAGIEVGYRSGVYNWVRANGYSGVAFARIDGSGDNVADMSNDSGRLSFMIHKYHSYSFSEILRIKGNGSVIIGDDDAGASCDSTVAGKLIIAQPTDTHTGGLVFVNTLGTKAGYMFVDVNGKLQIRSDPEGMTGMNINNKNGTVDIGNTTDNSAADYILKVNGNIVPSLNNAYDLGSSLLKFDDIWATNNVIQTSDKREKTEIKTSDFGLSFVKGMKPRSFKRKDGKRRHYGFIAQEVETLVKKFGISTKDAAFIVKDKKGNYGLRYVELIAILVKAIQELDAKLEG